jgi:CheY-like chemotaxis protein
MSRSASRSADKPPLDGLRILVVDDNADTAALMRQLLLSAGAADVAVACDGREALTFLTHYKPDVLVTDMVMPVTGGLELIRTVRHAARVPTRAVPDPTLPIVLVSAFASRGSVRAAQSVGIDAFVIKPFSIGSLVKRVDRAARRTAAFIITEAYVGPDRRTKSGAGRNRRSDTPVEDTAHVPAPTPPPAKTSPKLRVVTPDDPSPAVPSPSLLKTLHARIQALEGELNSE